MENRKASSREKERAASHRTHRIPYLAGRPKRERVIDRDDLLNVEILLNTCKTVEDVLKELSHYPG
jgi:hypothetical protein